MVEKKESSKNLKSVRFVDSSNPGADAREKPVSLKPLKVDEALRGLLKVHPEDKSDG